MKSLAKYLLLISAALMLIPVATDAQRRGAKNKPKKTAYNSEEELAKAKELFDAYAFDEAIKQLETAIEKGKKAEADVTKEEALLQKSQLGASMLLGTERVVFIDSTVVDSKEVLRTMQLSPECGRLAALSAIVQNAAWARDLAPAPAYVNQFGDKLLLAYPDSDGVKRIASSFKLGDGWTEPKPLSGMTDVEGDQCFPYLLADGVTLYFAKDDEEAIGGYDLFITRYDTQTKAFLKAENMGFPFNSPANDYFCVIDETLGIGYLASDRNQPQGKVCIYRFIPNSARDTYQLVDDNAEQVRRAARIASLAESQKGQTAQIDAAFNRLRKSMETDATSRTAKIHRFIINDDIVYTSLAQFKSPTARLIASDLAQIQSQIKNQQELLENLRKQWGAGNHDEKLRDSIREMANRIQQAQKKLNNMAKNMRKAELGEK